MEIHTQELEDLRMIRLISLLIYAIFLTSCGKALYIENDRFYSSEINKQYDLGAVGFRITISKGMYINKKLHLEGIVFDSFDKPIEGLIVSCRSQRVVKSLSLTDSTGKFQIVLENADFDNIDLIFGGGQLYVQREFSLYQMMKK